MAQPHRPVTVTILSAPCLRLRLSAMIQLGVSNEIIVVVPEVTPDTLDVCCLALCKIDRRIDAVLLKSCDGITSSERSEQLEILHNRHRRSRNECILFEYAVRVKKYAEQYRIEK